MGVLEWLLILGIALVYAFVLVAVIWLVFHRRSRSKPSPAQPPSETSKTIASPEGKFENPS